MQTRTRTRSVVFTDMEGYTRMTGSTDREGLRNLLAMHQRFVEPVLTGRGGRVVKNIGDSFMALFESATDAVRACLDLVEAHAPGQGSPVTFRASIATGDVEETENDAFGEPVNLAARINSITPGGEVRLSKGTWHCMNQAEIPWESVGRHHLKGIYKEVEVFRAVPRHAAYLPEVLAAAVRGRAYAIWIAGEPMPPMVPGLHVVLEGYRPASPQLAEAVDRLPIADPGHIWLSTYNISPSDRWEWTRAGRGMVVGTPQAVRQSILAIQNQALRPPSGSDTIILDGSGAATVELVIAGLALPSVPLAEVVAAYAYDLLPDGRWLNRSDRGMVRVEVNNTGAWLTVLVPGVQVDGRIAPVNTSLQLRDGMEVRTPGCALRYVSVEQEGYLGALVGDTQMRLGVSTGQRVEMGREPNHPGLLLPDRNNQDNIQWCPGPRAARARERGFTLDKVLTGRRQTALRVEPDRLVLEPMHETCPTLLLGARGQLHRLVAPEPARLGDILVLGTTVVALREPSM